MYRFSGLGDPFIQLTMMPSWAFESDSKSNKPSWGFGSDSIIKTSVKKRTQDPFFNETLQL